MSNLNEMESESDSEAVGECIIDEEHRAEDEEAVFRRVYDYLAEKKYPDGASKDAKRAVRKKAQRYSFTVCTLYARKLKHLARRCQVDNACCYLKF